MKRNVRLIAVFLIAVQMFMLCASCFAETTTKSDATIEGGSFVSKTIANSRATISDWYADSSKRALFTVVLACELGMHLEAENKDTIELEDMLANICFNPSYIGREGFKLDVYIDDGTHQFFMTYDFLTGIVEYLPLDIIDDSIGAETVVLSILEGYCDSYYENKSENLLEAVVALTLQMS